MLIIYFHNFLFHAQYINVKTFVFFGKIEQSCEGCYPLTSKIFHTIVHRVHCTPRSLNRTLDSPVCTHHIATHFTILKGMIPQYSQFYMWQTNRASGFKVANLLMWKKKIFFSSQIAKIFQVNTRCKCLFYCVIESAIARPFLGTAITQPDTVQ